MADYDIIVDATDSLSTKLLINDTVWHSASLFVHGGMYRYMGQAMTYVPGSPLLSVPLCRRRSLCSRAMRS